MEQLGTKIKSIVMPALGTGNQNLSSKNTINALLSELKVFLKKETSVEKILFIEYNKEKSLQISTSLDEILNRSEIQLPINELVISTKDEILKTIQSHGDREFIASDTYKLLRDTFSSDNVKSIVYGITCRRLTEKMLNDIYQSEEGFSELSFFYKIKKMSEMNVAKWVISYLHVIRIFGNESAHDIHTHNQTPKSIGERDLSLLLFCIQRIVEFWVNNKTKINANTL
jgi:replicative superfamily II helicase